VQDKESDSSVESTTENRIECWKDVVGGKSRGRVYGTADLAANIHDGVSSHTQPSTISRVILPTKEQFQEAERLREKVRQATQRATVADEKVAATSEGLIETNKKCAMMEEEMKLMKRQLALVLERQTTNSSTGTSHVHPYYDPLLDDQPIPWTWTSWGKSYYNFVLAKFQYLMQITTLLKLKFL